MSLTADVDLAIHQLRLREAKALSGGHWISVKSSAGATHLYISDGGAAGPSGTVLAGPHALLQANIRHLPGPPTHTTTHHPAGHTPEGATDQDHYGELAEAPKGSRARKTTDFTFAQHERRLAAKSGKAQPGAALHTAFNAAKSEKDAYEAAVRGEGPYPNGLHPGKGPKPRTHAQAVIARDSLPPGSDHVKATQKLPWGNWSDDEKAFHADMTKAGIRVTHVTPSWDVAGRGHLQVNVARKAHAEIVRGMTKAPVEIHRHVGMHGELTPGYDIIAERPKDWGVRPYPKEKK